MNREINYDELAQRVAQSILADNFLNKDTLIPKIRAIMAAYLRSTLLPKDGDNAKKKTISAWHRERSENEFLIAEFRKIYSKEQMVELFRRRDIHQKEKGFL